MTILQFTQIIGNAVPDGWDYYATGERTDYNRKRDVDNTMVVTLPNPYPTWYRGECSKRVQFTVWLFQNKAIKVSTTGTQQHNPYSNVEIRDGLMAIARNVINTLNEQSAIQVVSAPDATFYDSPEGQSVNSQVVLELPITADIYVVPITMDSTIITSDSTAVTV